MQCLASILTRCLRHPRWGVQRPSSYGHYSQALWVSKTKSVVLQVWSIWILHRYVLVSCYWLIYLGYHNTSWVPRWGVQDETHARYLDHLILHYYPNTHHRLLFPWPPWLFSNPLHYPRRPKLVHLTISIFSQHIRRRTPFILTTYKLYNSRQDLTIYFCNDVY